MVSEAGICAYLKNKDIFTVDVRKTVDSTNNVLRSLASKDAPEGYVLTADEQTAGKGRLGRSFHSPAGKGVYFSLLLRPNRKAGDAALLTSAAAVATARAIEEVYDISVGIKWVNDLYKDGKKVCGILTEAEFSMENGFVESAVLGIGINIVRPEGGFPEELESVATALISSETSDDMETPCAGFLDHPHIKEIDLDKSKRNRLIAASLDNFWEYYIDLPARRFLEEYRSRSILLGQDIYVLSNDGDIPARALAIDDECRLVVRLGNGEISTLSSGEVSIKVKHTS